MPPPPSSRSPPHLEVIPFVIVHVEGTEELRVPGDLESASVHNTLQQGLPGKFLHLDVVKLTEVAEPLDELGGDAAAELAGGEPEDGVMPAWILPTHEPLQTQPCTAGLTQTQPCPKAAKASAGATSPGCPRCSPHRDSDPSRPAVGRHI